MKINKINIQGGNQQFGDKIINNSKHLDRSDLTILDLIDKHGNTTEEKEELINAMEIVKNSGSEPEKSKKAKGRLKTFLDSMVSQGGKEIIRELIQNGPEYLQSLL